MPTWAGLTIESATAVNGSETPVVHDENSPCTLPLDRFAYVKAKREAWFALQPDLDPSKLVFVDETGATTKMARLRGWAPRGERCRAAIPHGHWKTITFVGGLTRAGFIAPMLVGSALRQARRRSLNREALDRD